MKISFMPRLDVALVRDQYDALVRIVSSLRNRTAPAHVVLERLAASADRPARALTMLGRIVKTIYILRYGAPDAATDIARISPGSRRWRMPTSSRAGRTISRARRARTPPGYRRSLRARHLVVHPCSAVDLWAIAAPYPDIKLESQNVCYVNWHL